MKHFATTPRSGWLPAVLAVCLCACVAAAQDDAVSAVPVGAPPVAPAAAANSSAADATPVTETAAPAPTGTGVQPDGQASAGDDAAALAALRDPFWPIGWKPAPVSRTQATTEAQPQGPIRWDEATRMLVLSSLVQLPQGGYLATLKGIGVVEPGDKIAVSYGGLTYHWEVRSITEKGIVPRRLGVSSQRGD